LEVHGFLHSFIQCFSFLSHTTPPKPSHYSKEHGSIPVEPWFEQHAHLCLKKFVFYLQSLLLKFLKNRVKEWGGNIYLYIVSSTYFVCPTNNKLIVQWLRPFMTKFKQSNYLENNRNFSIKIPISTPIPSDLMTIPQNVKTKWCIVGITGNNPPGGISQILATSQRGK